MIFRHVVPLHNVTTNKSENLKGYLAHFPYSMHEEIQEPERLGDLFKVTQLVSGSALGLLTSGYPIVTTCWASVIL